MIVVFGFCFYLTRCVSHMTKSSFQLIITKVRTKHIVVSHVSA